MATAQATDLILATFDPQPYELIQKIPVRVRPVEDSFVATFVDANVNASGETAQDAVENLKDLMAALFETLGALPKERRAKARPGNWRRSRPFSGKRTEMATITTQHALKIVRKLKATVVKGTKAHDVAQIYHEGRLVASFGIRRGSNKNLPHGHIPDDLHLRPRETIQLANCPLSREAWLQRMREQGLIEEVDGEENDPVE